VTLCLSGGTALPFERVKKLRALIYPLPALELASSEPGYVFHIGSSIES